MDTNEKHPVEQLAEMVGGTDKLEALLKAVTYDNWPPTEEQCYAGWKFSATLRAAAPELLRRARRLERIEPLLNEAADHLYTAQDMSRVRGMAQEIRKALEER